MSDGSGFGETRFLLQCRIAQHVCRPRTERLYHDDIPVRGSGPGVLVARGGQELALRPMGAGPVRNMILEGIVTTISPEGTINVAPMGPRVEPGMDRFVLRPFKTAQTYRHL